MFKDENNVIVGLTTYDTCYDDRVYLIHLSSDKLLLESMVDIVTKDEGDRAILKVKFYFRIGFRLSSEVYDWTRNN